MKERRSIEHAVVVPPVVLQVNGLSYRAGERALFVNWSARIRSGITLVRGGDGSGKTTLLRLLAGELPADAGHLQVNDVSLGERAHAYRRQVFWINPKSDAFEQTTPDDFFLTLPRHYPQFDERRLLSLIEGLSLESHRKKQFHMLSTGSKRKVWLAAAFASGAALTLIDEPFAALDKASVRFVIELLKSAAAHPSRAWLLAHYEAPSDVALAAIIDLGD